MLELECPRELRAAALAALEARGVRDGHLTVELVDDGRIRELNRSHRGLDEPTDVLSFPVDGAEPVAGPRELGDVVICPAAHGRPRRGDRARRPASGRAWITRPTKARCLRCRTR